LAQTKEIISFLHDSIAITAVTAAANAAANAATTMNVTKDDIKNAIENQILCYANGAFNKFEILANDATSFASKSGINTAVQIQDLLSKFDFTQTNSKAGARARFVAGAASDKAAIEATIAYYSRKREDLKTELLGGNGAGAGTEKDLMIRYLSGALTANNAPSASVAAARSPCKVADGSIADAASDAINDSQFIALVHGGKEGLTPLKGLRSINSGYARQIQAIKKFKKGESLSEITFDSLNSNIIDIQEIKSVGEYGANTATDTMIDRIEKIIQRKDFSPDKIDMINSVISIIQSQFEGALKNDYADTNLFFGTTFQTSSLKSAKNNFDNKIKAIQDKLSVKKEAEAKTKAADEKVKNEAALKNELATATPANIESILKDVKNIDVLKAMDPRVRDTMINDIKDTAISTAVAKAMQIQTEEVGLKAKAAEKAEADAAAKKAAEAKKLAEAEEAEAAKKAAAKKAALKMINKDMKLPDAKKIISETDLETSIAMEDDVTADISNPIKAHNKNVETLKSFNDALGSEDDATGEVTVQSVKKALDAVTGLKEALKNVKFSEAVNKAIGELDGDEKKYVTAYVDGLKKTTSAPAGRRMVGRRMVGKRMVRRGAKKTSR